MIALDTNVVVRRASSSTRTATLPGFGNANTSVLQALSGVGLSDRRLIVQVVRLAPLVCIELIIRDWPGSTRMAQMESAPVLFLAGWRNLLEGISGVTRCISR